jgi:hypothetical protein
VDLTNAIDWARVIAPLNRRSASATRSAKWGVHDTAPTHVRLPVSAGISWPRYNGPHQTPAATGEARAPECALDKQDVALTDAKIHVRDSKTPPGVRVVDIRPRLRDELRAYAASLSIAQMSDPFFPTRTGGRRDRNNVLDRVVVPAVRRANALRAERDEPPIRAHVTPHTFRRTYITFMLAAGFDVPYVQDQVGHSDPATTLAIYARVIRSPDRDMMRAEMRALFGEDRAKDQLPVPAPTHRTDGRQHERDERDGMER